MPSTSLPPFDRLMRHIEKRPDGCWQFTGKLTGSGYSRLGRSGDSPEVKGHRPAYETLIGPIPDGLELDHICRNRACVNPAHLEPVTHQVNLLRGDWPANLRRQQTHCIRGHEFTLENTHIRTNGTRLCRACARTRQAAKKKVAAS